MVGTLNPYICFWCLESKWHPIPRTNPVVSHTDGSHLPVSASASIPPQLVNDAFRELQRKSGAHITQIYASEDELYLRCFEEHRHAEWVALSMNTGPMKEMSDCNLARLFHRHHTYTHTPIPTPTHIHSLFPFSSKDFGRWRRLCLARSFPTLKKPPLLSLMKASHNSGVVMTGLCTTLSLPPPGQGLCIHRRLSFSHHRAKERGEKTSAPPQC